MQAPPETWPWLAAIRARKIAVYVSYAESILDFSRDAGWNIAQVKCKTRLACSPMGTITSQPEGIQILSNLRSFEGLDLVVSHHTLGLLKDPHQALVDLHGTLKKKGRLLVYLPLETERSLKTLQDEDATPWLYTWNVQTFANLLGETGFELLESKTVRQGHEMFALGCLRRFGGGQRAFHFWLSFSQLFQPRREMLFLARPFVD